MTIGEKKRGKNFRVAQPTVPESLDFQCMTFDSFSPFWATTTTNLIVVRRRYGASFPLFLPHLERQYTKVLQYGTI